MGLRIVKGHTFYATQDTVGLLYYGAFHEAQECEQNHGHPNISVPVER